MKGAIVDRFGRHTRLVKCKFCPRRLPLGQHCNCQKRGNTA